MPQPTPIRYSHLDILKALATVGVFLFHVSIFFALGGWMVKNNDLLKVFSVIILILSLWIMPMFFFVGGVTARYSIEHRSAGKFLIERIKRLIVPLIIFSLLLAPIQSFYTSRQWENYGFSFFVFLKTRYIYIFTDPNNYKFPQLFMAFNQHLWFLAFLFMMSVVGLIFLNLLKVSKIRSLPSTILKSKWLVLILTIPFAFIRWKWGFSYWEYGGRTDFLFWLSFFIFGMLLLDRSDFQMSLHSMRYLTLSIAIVSNIIIFYILSVNNLQVPSLENKFSELYMINWGIASWNWVCALAGFAIAYKDRNFKIVNYINKISMPFYILHHPIIVIVGFHIRNLNLPILFKFLFLVIITIVIVGAFHEYVIKRNSFVQMMFGVSK